MSANSQSRVLALETEGAMRLFESLGTARSLTCAILLRYGEFDQLVSLRCDPKYYGDWQSFSDDYQCTELLKKNPRLPTSYNRREEALSKWRAAEAQCKDTNQRLSAYARGDCFPVSKDVHRAVHYAREFIRRVLGSSPSRRDLDYAESQMRFGPGATTSVSGIVTRGRKFSERTLDATTRMVSFRAFCFPDLWKQTAAGLNVVEASKLTTVPKTAKTDRVICIEPDLNIFVQLGLGALLRSKLGRFGCDLRTQDYNRWLASRAGELGLCTVDLSSASDTIAREAVWNLLPCSWAELLHLPRVDQTSVDGVLTPLEKWSSMGNGYTFELETLIFLGICHGVCETLDVDSTYVNAYGDDLILPLDALELLRQTLDFLGFSVNPEKTFGEGLFFESCGTDYFSGRDVRPIYFRADHERLDYTEICCLYSNSIRRIASRRLGGVACDVRFLRLWLYLVGAIPKCHRLRIPAGFDDTSGIVSSFEEASPSTYGRSRFGWGGYHFRYRRRVAVSRTVSVLGAYIGSLGSSSSSFTGGREDLRGRVRTRSHEWGYTLRWSYVGPWV